MQEAHAAALSDASGQKRKRRLPIVPERTMRPEVLVSVLDRQHSLRRHPDNPLGSKYIVAYQTANGRVIAAETNLAAYAAIWVEAGALPQCEPLLSDMSVVRYEPSESRNSNLRRYGRIFSDAAYRIIPRDPEEVLMIVNAVVDANPS